MKKNINSLQHIILAAYMVIVMAVVCRQVVAGEDEISVVKIFDSVTLGAGSNSTSKAIDLYQYKPLGNFSVHVDVSASNGGLSALTYQISNNNQDYATPTGVANICSGWLTNSGANADGVQVFEFDPVFSRYIRFNAAVTGNFLTVNCWLAIQ